MKKKIAKIFVKYGEKKIELVKKYKPKSKRPVTSAIVGARMDINNAIGNVLLKAKKEEQKLVGKTLKGDYFEDWDSEKRTVIKY